jgi:hypothetical protein
VRSRVKGNEQRKSDFDNRAIQKQLIEEVKEMVQGGNPRGVKRLADDLLSLVLWGSPIGSLAPPRVQAHPQAPDPLFPIDRC